jgi:uncharacterized membrane protein YbhN (UPF0104 family)
MRLDEKQKRIAIWAGGTAVFLLLGMFLWDTFQDLDLSRVAERIQEIGPAAVFILLPWAGSTAAESIGWSLCIPGKERLIPGRKLFILRVATEALTNTLPMGAAAADTARPILLNRRFGLDFPRAITSCFVTKVNIAAAQAGFIFLGLLFSIIYYPIIFQRSGIPGGAVTAFCVTLVFGGIMVLPYSGTRLGQLHAQLLRIPVKGIRSLLRRIQSPLARIDTLIGEFRRHHPGRLAASLAWFMASWCFFALESFLILRLLGADITFAHAVALEGVASIMRMLFFFIPGGLGAQEVGYVMVLSSFGLPEPLTLSASYIMLKRSKEVFWSTVGYISMGFLGLRLRDLNQGQQEPLPEQLPA